MIGIDFVNKLLAWEHLIYGLCNDMDETNDLIYHYGDSRAGRMPVKDQIKKLKNIAYELKDKAKKSVIIIGKEMEKK